MPGLVIVKLSEGAEPGHVCLYTKAGSHLLVDVAGYFPAGSGFHPVVPQRLLDTRGLGTADGLQNGAGPVAARGVFVLDVRGRAGVPAEADAVALNLVATETGGPGYVTAYPCGTPRPVASTVNYNAGQTRSNAAVTQIGADGTVQQGQNRLGKVRVVSVADQQQLERAAGSAFSAGGQTITDADPATYQVQQGALEGTNASPVTNLVALIETMRGFEAYMTATTRLDQVNERVISDVARV